MKLFRVGTGYRPTPIDLDENDEIVVGDRPRRKWHEQARIPIVGEGPEVRVKETDEGIVLVRGDWAEEPRCLAVVNPVGKYDRDRSYKIHDARGLTALAAGHILFGQAGKVNGGKQRLVLVDPGAEFRLNSKHASTWFRWDGSEWMSESPAQRSARLAVETVEQGGGEWL